MPEHNHHDTRLGIRQAIHQRKEEVKNARLGAESTSANTVEYYVVIDKALRFQLHKKRSSTNPFSDEIRDTRLFG